MRLAATSASHANAPKKSAPKAFIEKLRKEPPSPSIMLRAIAYLHERQWVDDEERLILVGAVPTRAILDG